MIMDVGISENNKFVRRYTKSIAKSHVERITKIVKTNRSKYNIKNCR